MLTLAEKKHPAVREDDLAGSGSEILQSGRGGAPPSRRGEPLKRKDPKEEITLPS